MKKWNWLAPKPPVTRRSSIGVPQAPLFLLELLLLWWFPCCIAPVVLLASEVLMKGTVLYLLRGRAPSWLRVRAWLDAAPSEEESQEDNEDAAE